MLNLNKLTYAGVLSSLRSVENDPRYRFVRADICDAETVRAIIAEHRPRVISHLAAESHVDRSINCAAYTAVDKAEDDADAACAANATGPALLATATAAAGFPLVHISTDCI